MLQWRASKTETERYVFPAVRNEEETTAILSKKTKWLFSILETGEKV